MADEIKEGLWDAKEVSAFLKVDEETVYRWAKAGRLRSVKVGRFIRFRPADMQEVAENGVPAIAKDKPSEEVA